MEAIEIMEFRSSRRAAALRFSLTRLLFPITLRLAAERVETVRVRSFLMPWMREEEQMRYERMASTRRSRGMTFDKLTIESTGGSNDIAVGQLRKRDADALAEALEVRMAATRDQGAG